MNKEQIDKSFNALNPTKEQKDRMLQNILAHTRVNEAPREDKIISLDNRRKTHSSKWMGLAAALVLVVGIGTAWQIGVLVGPGLGNEQGMQGSTESPMGMRKLMNYEGYRYAFLNDGESFKLKGEELEEELGQVPEDATFAQGGVIYTLRNYAPTFRVAIEWEGNYYIAERVAKADDSEMDIKAYVESMALENNLEKVVISDQIGMEVLKTLSEEEEMLLIENFSKAEIAQLESTDYEKMARAQSEGKSYKISLVLKDGTVVESYVILSMNYISVGDYTCTLENLNEKIGSLFEGLTASGSVPME